MKINRMVSLMVNFQINVHVQWLDTTKDKTEARNVDSLL